MSKVKWPKLKDLFGMPVEVSPFVPDSVIVLVGREVWKDPLHFSRQLSVLNLKTGKVTGCVHYGEVELVQVSDKNKDMFDSAGVAKGVAR